jgi:CBS domain containing-hemolysin-like protein
LPLCWDPLFERFGLSGHAAKVISFIISFVIVTFLHVVLGELAPKTVAIQRAEQVALYTAKPIIMFNKIMYPFIWLLNKSANLFVRLFGMKPASEHEEAASEEEIRIILSESYESGKINKTELSYVNRIFTFDDLLAREIMVPRTDMMCLYADKPLAENLRIIRKEQYTRFPVAKGSKDNIIGFINTKQFFLSYDNNPDFDIHSILMPPMTVASVMPVKELLRKMQAERVHIALLLDEYGGTAGIISLEDILEEIVGEIRDEFDRDEQKAVEMTGPNRYLVDGKVLLTELNGILGSALPHEEVHTVGGWIYSMNPDIRPGEKWSYDGFDFTVRVKERHRIRKVEIVSNL